MLLFQVEHLIKHIIQRLKNPFIKKIICNQNLDNLTFKKYLLFIFKLLCKRIIQWVRIYQLFWILSNPCDFYTSISHIWHFMLFTCNYVYPRSKTPVFKVQNFRVTALFLSLRKKIFRSNLKLGIIKIY